MKTTRILIIAIMLSMVASLFVACGNNEEKKKLLETKIELALRDNNFILAKDLSEELELSIF